MISIVIRMALSDFLFIVGIMVAIQSDAFSEGLTPVGVLGLVAAAAGLVGSTWMTLSLVRYMQEQRRRLEQRAASGDRGRSGDGADRHEW